MITLRETCNADSSAF